LARRNAGAIVLAVAAIGVYANSFSGTYHLDDLKMIVTCDTVHDLSAAVGQLVGDLRPVVTLSLAVNYAIAGLDVWGYHAVNVAAHALATLALYALLRRTVSPGVALAATLLWAVHPLQTQSVTYIIQRAQVFMGLFQFMTLYCLARSAVPGARRAWWSVAAVAACAAGMGCKQDMVVVPVVAALYDRVFLAGSWREVARRRWALYLGLAATWVVLAPSFGVAVRPPAETPVLASGPDPFPMAGLDTADPMNSPRFVDRDGPSAGLGMSSMTPRTYAQTQPEVILHYLWLAVCPRSLCFDYSDWPVAHNLAAAAPAAAALLTLLAATGAALWYRPTVGFFASWFFLALAPTSSVLPIFDVAFEHRMYVPLAAMAVLLVLSGRAVLNAACAPGWVGPALVAAAAVTLGTLTMMRNLDYRTKVSLLEDTLAKRPGNWRTRHNLAIAYYEAGQYEQALEHFQATARERPVAHEHALLAGLLTRMGRFEEATEHFRIVVYQVDRMPAASIEHRTAVHYNLAKSLSDLGRPDEAVTHYREAVRLNPENASAWNNLAGLLNRGGKYDEALACLEKLLVLQPASPLVQNNSGVVLARLGQHERAAGHFRRAVELDPRYLDAWSNWGHTLMRLGKTAEAELAYRRAYDLRPGSVPGSCNLAWSLKHDGKADEAGKLYRLATRTDPAWPQTYAGQAWPLATDPDDRRRDPARAVRLAEQAAQGANERDAEVMDTLAAAYAADGRYTSAAAAAKTALALAEARKLPRAAAIRTRLALYEQGLPFRDAPETRAGR
jgi:tetratricopeptide (TPR) repeat protein